MRCGCGRRSRARRLLRRQSSRHTQRVRCRRRRSTSHRSLSLPPRHHPTRSSRRPEGCRCAARASVAARAAPGRPRPTSRASGSWKSIPTSTPGWSGCRPGAGLRLPRGVSRRRGEAAAAVMTIVRAASAVAAAGAGAAEDAVETARAATETVDMVAMRAAKAGKGGQEWRGTVPGDAAVVGVVVAGAAGARSGMAKTVDGPHRPTRAALIRRSRPYRRRRLPPGPRRPRRRTARRGIRSGHASSGD